MVWTTSRIHTVCIVVLVLLRYFGTGIDYLQSNLLMGFVTSDADATHIYNCPYGFLVQCVFTIVFIPYNWSLNIHI